MTAPPGGGACIWSLAIQHTVFMLTGTIKFFNKSKGFGFITSDAGGKEVFLPSATVTASALRKVEPGLRVSFQEEPDAKGPKAVALKLLDEPARVPPPQSRPPQAVQKAAAIVLYHDPASPAFETVRAALAAQDIVPELVDYTATPPAPEELKKWSLALSGHDAGLVRRSDPMFFALQLDDRFNSESDFWLAVSQHPKLINGPILRMSGRLTICKTADDVRRFLGMEASAAKPKGISARLSALIRGVALPPVEEPVAEAPQAAARKETPAPKVKPVAAAKPAVKAKPAAKEKPAPKARPAAKTAAKAKPAAKPKAAAKKPVAKAKPRKR
jgi:cold shock CspA family protein/arsenate reductase-like glutaredoxin family protein